MRHIKTLLLDIETAPNTAHVWGLWDQNIGLNQLMESSYVMCWAAKWLDQQQVMWARGTGTHRKSMLQRVHKLLDQADCVIHYNGTKFDIPTLNKEFIIHDMHQPSPYKQMDLLRVARKQFKFASNKLDYVARALGVGQKLAHHGHELWVQCMGNDKRAWTIMERYNKNDVLIMEQVYYKLLPWMKMHTNVGLYTDKTLVCPNCGSNKYQRRGWAYTQLNKYTRYQCQSCASWFRGALQAKPAGERFTVI